MKTKEEEIVWEIKLHLLFGLIAGVAWGLFCGLIAGLSCDLVFSLVDVLFAGLVVGLFGCLVGLVIDLFRELVGSSIGSPKLIRGVTALIFGSFFGLVCGSVIGLTTQIIAYFSTELVFSPFDFWGCLISLIIVQIIGWTLVYKLKKKENEDAEG